MNEQDWQTAAQALVDAENNQAPIEPMSKTYPEAEIEDAYRVAMKVAELKEAAGRIVKGHKIGLTSKPMRDLTGATEPDFGYLFDNWFVDEGAVLPMARFNRPMVEAELAFVLGGRLSGPGVTAADVIRATDVVLPSIEIVDTRYTTMGPKMIVDSVSDAASCGLILLGACPRRLTDIDIRSIGATLYKNSVVEQSGMAAEVFGSPVNAVAWLANKMGEFGVAMEPGHVILSGSFIKAIQFAAGDTITASFSELGDVTFHAGA
jgi:2-keto-4-pentenoate hydratase